MRQYFIDKSYASATLMGTNGLGPTPLQGGGIRKNGSCKKRREPFFHVRQVLFGNVSYQATQTFGVYESQLRKYSSTLFARSRFRMHEKGEIKRMSFVSTGQRHSPEDFVVELPDDHCWPQELFAAPVLLGAYIFSEVAEPYLAFVKEQPRIGVVYGAFERSPYFIIFVHRGIVSRIATHQQCITDVADDNLGIYTEVDGVDMALVQTDPVVDDTSASSTPSTP